MQDQLNEIQQTLLSGLKQELAEFEAEFDRKLAIISSKIESESKELSRKGKNNQYDILELEAEVADLKKSPSIALTKFFQAAKLAKELERDFKVLRNLQQMRQYLEEEADLYLGNTSNITEFLDSLPSKHSIEAEAIRKLLRKHKNR